MAKQPKYIDKSLITPPEKTPEKVSKKTYSFRCDEKLLAAITEYSKIADISLPQLLSGIISDFLEDKILTNDFITDYDGSYINLKSHHDLQKNFEYELLYVPNNLDVWDDGYKSMNENFIHEILCGSK